MKKLFSMGIVLSLLLALLTGCQSPGPEQDLGDQYIPYTDNQYYYKLAEMQGSSMAESEDGYYALVDGYLYVKNKETGEVIPACNKPDCMHNDTEFNSDSSSNCNAYIGTILGLEYYNHKLYVMTGNHEVFEMDKSGTTRKKLLELREPARSMMVHRGYLYISYYNASKYSEEYTDEELKDLKCWVNRYRLDNWDGKAETVYEISEKYAQLLHMFAYGNRVYFSVSEAETTYTMIYNIIDHSIEKKEELTGYITPANGKLLHFVPSDIPVDKNATPEENVARKEKQMAVLSDLQGNLIQKTDIPMTYSTLSGNETLMAADNGSYAGYGGIPAEDRGIRFYDGDAKLIREIKLNQEAARYVIGMNEDYLFYTVKNDHEGVDIWAIDLHKLDDPDLKAEPFFVAEE